MRLRIMSRQWAIRLTDLEKKEGNLQKIKQNLILFLFFCDTEAQNVDGRNLGKGKKKTKKNWCKRFFIYNTKE